VKQQEKRGKDMSKLRDVITSLVRRLPLERKHNDHQLTGK
jgi:mRNA-degrading endonuclease YafQ of YafQ-DinJ toxin-antitoxin module